MKAIPKSLIFVVLGAAVCVTGAVTAMAVQGDSTPTFGTIPPGGVDSGSAPDLISVTDDKGDVVGYARKEDLLPAQNEELSRDEIAARNVLEVWDSTGEVLVGHLFPDGVGYLSLKEQEQLGVSPSNPPKAETTVTTMQG